MGRNGTYPFDEMSEERHSRRGFLSLVASGSLLGLSGCNQEPTGDSPATIQTTASTQTTSPRPTATATPEDVTSPVILVHVAEPKDTGTKLAVRMKGEDNRELADAVIQYGDRILQKQPESRTVDMEGILTEIPDAEPESPGLVSYTLRDPAGNETRKTAYADETAPALVVRLSTPETAEEIQVSLEGKDEVGLHELRTVLNGEPVFFEDVTGKKQVASQQTISSKDSDSTTPGEMNRVRAELEDALGNTTRKSVKQYVRKYDVMEDTRLSFGTVYQPYFAFELMDSGFESKVPDNCKGGRVPTIGQYERPLSFEVFNRHIDQMTGHGIDRVMIEFLGNVTGYHDKRFLESELIDQIQIEPFYTAPANLWREGNPSTVESYRDDLVQPHMTFMRDNILSKDNVTTYDGRPVLQMWNPALWALDDVYDRIIEEWGNYDNFFDNIRSLLTVNGEDPFFVGGTNWWGHGGYPGGRQAELTMQFDATTTWLIGEPLHDGFESQEGTLSWVEENWEGHREFTDSHGMEFIPMVFPGFNERTADGEACENTPGRRVPRSPKFFRQMLELADEYRTTDMVNNSVYNNWTEATHIEPGIFEPGPFDGEDYGTEYLEIVKEFQQPDN